MRVPKHLWVVPGAMKLVAPHGDSGQCFVADLDCRGVGILIECALDMPLGGPGAWLRARMDQHFGLIKGRPHPWAPIWQGPAMARSCVT
jgi:hypothetical protein